ncbi:MULTISPECIES: iron-sulfur cluster assembly scaffold protein [Thioclava]|uniref:Iron-sulfur cluster assembly scaffold protein n=1 Tax=Thioclava nitratireducens TaxID=1915078 RepID=A0ABM6IHX2_9RHOB|nr:MULTISPECIES: iron-sulfur cluster assembly scaffold protein [Thioclava]AQS48306.1 iron-sulfur cluster assembly scaffold protein [Thioclava nitratireducens]OWY04955.1 iron-sulfur cluster assembly scaffold protein [Thioclava sp. F1Mire-8]OWY06569.1 iron-sulfur cluster assembly scaffold protein [Thioclava sp. IC9]OWY09166.1 iron-sulfur cluster assembly scaffold protein [Thioclava sp. F42-5]OWY18516.1 iron-sulfur cluster assembly scaffold protein [Thioclava sp. JM3]
MSDTDLIKLYSQRILALAADMPGTDPLPEPDVTMRKRAPLCGSTVEVALTCADGRVTGYSQTVHACALGQASAAIFGAQVVGRTRDEIAKLRDQLAEMLKGGPVPDAPFGDYEVLQAARDYPNRHGSILLAPEATLEALEQC